MDPNLKAGLDGLYRTYGFEVSDTHEHIGIYIYKKSRYFGVDIVPLRDDESVMKQAKGLKEHYSNIGYAADIKSFQNIAAAELELYKSFFSFNSTITRLKKKYRDFVDKQTRNLLGNQYEYVDTPFELFDEQSELQKGLLKKIESLITGDHPQLIIIEAAAGYGKTCAAYEILRVFTDEHHFKTPIFTELARNRGAKIFRYILLDEIDVEFPTLNSDLVIHEIKNGRVPLVIDGFDELLDKVSSPNQNQDTNFEEIESMLDTLGNLLEGKTKIVLTTRKTAIFSGIEFDRWQSKWDKKFNVTRFSLKEPRIKDWLGLGRLQQIKDHDIPIQYIANPVILTFLKNVHDDEFNVLLENPENLVLQYFNSMLEREKERQHIAITVENQLEVFKNVVKLLLEFDITVESKDFFKQIIRDENSKLLEHTRQLYSTTDRPTMDNLVDALATHALLDRRGRDESQIGFINDFVIGIFIGEIICEAEQEKIENTYSNYMIELAATAYKVQSKANKSLLWEKIMLASKKFHQISIFLFDISLRESLIRDYRDLSVYETTFFNILFDKHLICNTVFLKCYFKNCRFNIRIFQSVSFVDCQFDGCEVLNYSLLDNTTEIAVIKCRELNCHVLAEVQYEEDVVEEDVEADILQKLWSISLTKSQHIMQLLQTFSKGEHKNAMRILDSLTRKDFLKITGNHIYFNPNKISEIKKIINVS